MVFPFDCLRKIARFIFFLGFLFWGFSLIQNTRLSFGRRKIKSHVFDKTSPCFFAWLFENLLGCDVGFFPFFVIFF